MTTRKLDATDFMKLDVHRPLTDAEIKEVNPQAAVDKSLGPVEDEHGAAASVDTPYPYEQPLPENVEILANFTKLDISPEEIFRNAFDAGMKEFVIVGVDGNDVERIFRTNSFLPHSMFWLQRGLHILNSNYDNAQDEDDDKPA